jgi:hypothetical protein
MQSVITTDVEEKGVAEELRKLDDLLLDFRNRIRIGERLSDVILKDQLRALGYIA